jgi:hypothetical protein
VRKGRRGYSGLDLGRSEDASFIVPPTGLSANALARDGSLRFDLANRDSDRTGIIFDISPGNITSFAFTYLHNMDTYNDTFYGLQNVSYDTYTGEVTLTPNEQWNLSAYYTHEKNGSAQVNNGTNNFPAVDNFTVGLNDSVDTAGASATFKLVPNKVTLNVSGRYQNLVGTAAFTTQPNSSYQLARASVGGVQNIPNADNAKLARFDASVDCAVSPRVMLTLGTWTRTTCSPTSPGGPQNIYPGAFFLALNDGATATVAYVRDLLVVDGWYPDRARGRIRSLRFGCATGGRIRLDRRDQFICLIPRASGEPATARASAGGSCGAQTQPQTFKFGSRPGTSFARPTAMSAHSAPCARISIARAIQAHTAALVRVPQRDHDLRQRRVGTAIRLEVCCQLRGEPGDEEIIVSRA